MGDLRKYLIGLAILLYGVLLKDWVVARYYSYKLASDAEKMGLSDQETVDYVRKLVHKNTIHLPLGDNDPRTTADQSVILKGIYKSLRYNSDLVAVTCGPRTAAMRSILGKDFELRTVHLFTDKYRIQSHTFLEVKINGQWQAHDPTFDVYYIASGGQRATTLQVLEGAARPAEGWKDQWATIKLQDYFKVLVYEAEVSGGSEWQTLSR